MYFADNVGYLTLMIFSFLAATIIPVSSEAALATTLAFGGHPVQALIFATIGNCAGVALNYWIGFLSQERFLQKHLRKKAVVRAYEITRKWGTWSLLLSWLPIIGDPITIIAGGLKVPFALFALVTFPLRLLRYVFIIGFFNL